MTSNDYRPRSNCIAYFFPKLPPEPEKREEPEPDSYDVLDAIRRFDGYGMYLAEEAREEDNAD